MCEIEDRAKKRLIFCCETAPKVPSRVEPQPDTNSSKEIKSLKTPSWTIRRNNKSTKTGFTIKTSTANANQDAPSYTSKAQAWNGNADSLKRRTQTSIATAIPIRTEYECNV